MSLQDKYDEIIECIEYFVKSDDADIPESVAKELGFNLRFLADAFLFVTDITLIKYIRQRRMVYALQKRLNSNLSVEQTAEIAGFSDAAAFSKACKNEFGLSPSQVSKIVLNNYPPMYFEKIVSTKYMEQMEANILNKDAIVTAESISTEQFAAAKRIIEIAALYGLNDDDAQFVYSVSKQYDIPLDDAVGVYESIKEDIEDELDVDYAVLVPRYVLCYKYGLSLGESKAILYEFSRRGVALEEVPEEFFQIYLSDINEKSPDLDIQTIFSMAVAMNDNGLSLEEVNDAMTYVTDPILAIEHYREFQEEEANFELLYDYERDIF